MTPLQQACAVMLRNQRFVERLAVYQAKSLRARDADAVRDARVMFREVRRNAVELGQCLTRHAAANDEATAPEAA